jgi:hypothetical protein
MHPREIQRKRQKEGRIFGKSDGMMTGDIEYPSDRALTFSSSCDKIERTMGIAL